MSRREDETWKIIGTFVVACRPIRLALLKDKFVTYVVLRPSLKPAEERLPKQQHAIPIGDHRANIRDCSIPDFQRPDHKYPRRPQRAVGKHIVPYANKVS